MASDSGDSSTQKRNHNNHSHEGERGGIGQEKMSLTTNYLWLWVVS